MKKHIFVILLITLLQFVQTSSNNHDFFWFPLGGAGKNQAKPVYRLTYQYAPRWGRPLQTSKFQVFWNQIKVADITPPDYNVHSQNWLLYTKPNQKNILKFIGYGTSDGYGASIDNIVITGTDRSQVLVQNGDFQNPDVGKGWKIQTIPGWKGEVQIGRSHLYNRDWCHTQVAELDAKGNVEISQQFDIDGAGKFVNFKAPLPTPKGATTSHFRHE